HGADNTRAQQIAAEARGRGIAHSILTAHSDTIHLLAGMQDGSILSIGEDRRIVLTKNGIMTTLADDVAVPIIARFSRTNRLLAYSSTTEGSVLFNIDTRRRMQISPKAALAFAFSSDGDRIAMLDRDSLFSIWSTDSQLRRLWHRTIPGGGYMLFSTPDR